MTWHKAPVPAERLRQETPLLVRRPVQHGDIGETYTEEAFCFEGQLYPSRLGYCVNWDDRITDAIEWREVLR